MASIEQNRTLTADGFPAAAISLMQLRTHAETLNKTGFALMAIVNIMQKNLTNGDEDQGSCFLSGFDQSGLLSAVDVIADRILAMATKFEDIGGSA